VEKTSGHFLKSRPPFGFNQDSKIGPPKKCLELSNSYLELLAHGIAVITACNVQPLESLNDAVARPTGVRVRVTAPDSFLQCADEVVNVDVSVGTLRIRLRQGKIYSLEKSEQAPTTSFVKAICQPCANWRSGKLHKIKPSKPRVIARAGLEPAALPEKVMVCLASRGNAKRLLRVGSRIAGGLASDWFAVYVETPREAPRRIEPEDYQRLQENLRLARELGAQVIQLKGSKVADALIEFARH
jgi:two-component system, OmpR family, sensor histidine kinase KdpD